MKESLTINKMVRRSLFSTSRAKPITFEDLLNKFSGKKRLCSRETLVQIINGLLVPHGPIRGQNYDFWYEPLPDDWRTIPEP